MLVTAAEERMPESSWLRLHNSPWYRDACPRSAGISLQGGPFIGAKSESVAGVLSIVKGDLVNDRVGDGFGLSSQELWDGAKSSGGLDD